MEENKRILILLHTVYCRISTYISVIALAMIAVGLLFSRGLISIGFIAFIANWIIEGKFSEKWELLKSNKNLCNSFPDIFYPLVRTYPYFGYRIWVKRS
ncbi:MAG: hypothetical protein HC831_01090 [Chloroflexia bacterium]|nr:hypothetical protein [Chloroflexia bacterium]